MNNSYFNNLVSKSNSIVLFVFTLLIINLSNHSQATEESVPQQTMRTGFYLDSFPDISLTDMEVALRYWVEEVGKQAGIIANVTIYKSLDKMRTDFYQKKINFVVASPLMIVNEFELNQLSGGYKVVWSDKTDDKLLVVTHKLSGLNQFKEVKNKQLSLLKNEQISEVYADVLSLQTFGQLSKKVFKRIDYLRKSSHLIYRLFFNNTDVIVIYQIAYNLAIELNPQIKSQTQIISELDEIPRVLGFFHHSVDPKFREKIVSAAEKFGTHPRGEQLLSLFQANKIIRSDISDLFATQQLQQKYEHLINHFRK